ncbi:small subunit ribosomal protein S1 [Mariprofundus micogutta]|uniref:Small subunit ribosomal protein S1 n=1 Tax=Mariprofundus micogutta TaxID=1921010 RepID=A0A1L8CLH3_9PROT|nr:30S ribosomal protein S1 [Mariprofundus micogutta]GAV19768.1 small subunit ribosomal protein S1 [Mariprofundus micogutta]
MSEAQNLEEVQETTVDTQETPVVAEEAPAAVEETPVVAEEAAAEDTAEEESFKQMFEASLKEQPIVKRGEMIKGMIVSVNADTVTMDVGAKGEGTIPVAEFTQAGIDVPAVGEEIDAMVQSVGGGSGVVLSVLAAKQREAWTAIETASENGEAIDAIVTAEVKGGFRVNLSGLNAFMPRSEADTDMHVSADQLVGKACKVAVLEARRRPENIVVSRKKPMSVERDAQRAVFFESKAVGDKLSGEIKRMADFGAFVDLGGVDALLHVSDISWRRIKHPSEMLAVGQSVTVEIVKMNAETGKVSVSMKALQSDPWENVAVNYEAGMRLTGTVRRLLEFGAVVEIEPGIEGMIHRSELSWTKNDVKPASVLSEGDVVDVAVLEVDADARRIRLSLKAVSDNPWQSWLADHPISSHITGKIKNVTDFGFFVPVAEGMDGLVHMENLSWEQKGAEALAEYSKGQDVECVVLGVDAEKQRISLGIKQLSGDPFELFMSSVKRGDSVNGTVAELNQGGSVINLAEGVQAFLPRREVPREHAELKVGDEVEAKIIEVNHKRRQVDLSIRQQLRDEERDAMRNYSKQAAEESAPSALALQLQRMLEASEAKKPAKKAAKKK